MSYLNEAGSKLEGSGFTQADMERVVQENGPYFTAQGFMMVMQTAFMKHMMKDMDYSPPTGGMEMDYGMYYDMMTAVQRLTGRLQGGDFDQSRLEEYLKDAGFAKLLDGDNESWEKLKNAQYKDPSELIKAA